MLNGGLAHLRQPLAVPLPVTKARSRRLEGCREGAIMGAAKAWARTADAAPWQRGRQMQWRACGRRTGPGLGGVAAGWAEGRALPGPCRTHEASPPWR